VVYRHLNAIASAYERCVLSLNGLSFIGHDGSRADVSLSTRHLESNRTTDRVSNSSLSRIIA